MKKNRDESVIAITSVLVMAIFVGFFALVSYLFKECWNLGFAKFFSLNEVDFESSTYMVGLISLIGYIFRGWGFNSISSLGKEKDFDNRK